MQAPPRTAEPPEKIDGRESFRRSDGRLRGNDRLAEAVGPRRPFLSPLFCALGVRPRRRRGLRHGPSRRDVPLVESPRGRLRPQPADDRPRGGAISASRPACVGGCAVSSSRWKRPNPWTSCCAWAIRWPWRRTRPRSAARSGTCWPRCGPAERSSYTCSTCGACPTALASGRNSRRTTLPRGEVLIVKGVHRAGVRGYIEFDRRRSGPAVGAAKRVVAAVGFGGRRAGAGGPRRRRREGDVFRRLRGATL